jgi:6-phosphogluconolactonase/glucosamine-6-phosphate isomerase/deaminase
MTFPLLNAVPCVFLVTGRGKAAVVSRAVSGGDVPAGRILDPLWLLDDDAASALVV